MGDVGDREAAEAAVEQQSTAEDQRRSFRAVLEDRAAAMKKVASRCARSK